MKLQLIDESVRPDHFYLREEDECYFWGTYASRRSYDYSPMNQIISNLKKGMNKKGQRDWQYKLQAIEECSHLMRKLSFKPTFKITFIPVPPSKKKGDPLYDDRLVQILNKAYNNSDNINIIDLFDQSESRESCHSTSSKRNISELQDNLCVSDPSLCKLVGDQIIIFDDVVTTGAHFIAMKNKLKKLFPDRQIAGIFIARRIFVD